jgi:hypothetical protein
VSTRRARGRPAYVAVASTPTHSLSLSFSLSCSSSTSVATGGKKRRQPGQVSEAGDQGFSRAAGTGGSPVGTGRGSAGGIGLSPAVHNTMMDGRRHNTGVGGGARGCFLSLGMSHTGHPTSLQCVLAAPLFAPPFLRC